MLSLFSYLRAFRTPSGSPLIWIVFPAYSVISTTYVRGSCSTITGSPITLAAAFSVDVPPGPNPTDYEASAEGEFMSTALSGFPFCGNGVPYGVRFTSRKMVKTFLQLIMHSRLMLTLLEVSQASTTNVVLTTTPSNSPSAMPSGLETGAEVGRVVAASICLLVLLLGAVYFWRRRQTKSDQEPSEHLGSTAKAEIEGSDMRHGDGDKHELPVVESCQELLGDGERHELSV
jgi:hypothetical protein